MSQDFAVQEKRPSVLPRAIIGGAAGAAVGWGASCIPALKAPRYTSFDDILRESYDTFKKLGEEVKGNDELKKAYDAISAKRSEYANKVYELTQNAKSGLTSGVNAKVATEHAAYTAKRGILNTKLGEAANNLVGDPSKWEAIGFKEFLGEGADSLTDAQKIQKAKAFIKKNVDKTVFTDYKTAREEVKTALKALKEKAKTEGVSYHEVTNWTDEAKNKLKEEVGKIEKSKFFESIKDEAKKFTKSRLGLMLGVGAAAGLLLALLTRPKAKQEQQTV